MHICILLKLEECSAAYNKYISKPQSNPCFNICFYRKKCTVNFFRRLDDDFQGWSTAGKHLTKPFLTCGFFHAFWVMWQNGFIQVGFGIKVGSDVIVTWQDPDPVTVKHLLVSSDNGRDFWVVYTNCSMG